MRKNKKGFTLAELLVVLAIVAVLAAIAIPTFSSQLEAARETADLNNLRAGYADALTEAMLNTTSGTATTYTANVTVSAFTQTKTGWDSVTSPVVAGVSISSFTPKAGDSVSLDYAFSITNGVYTLTSIGNHS